MLKNFRKRGYKRYGSCHTQASKTLLRPFITLISLYSRLEHTLLCYGWPFFRLWQVAPRKANAAYGGITIILFRTFYTEEFRGITNGDP